MLWLCNSIQQSGGTSISREERKGQERTISAFDRLVGSTLLVLNTRSFNHPKEATLPGLVDQESVQDNKCQESSSLRSSIHSSAAIELTRCPWAMRPERRSRSGSK